MNVVNITLSKIVPDANQPRKFFDEAKIATLKASIKTHGIKNPLILEVQKDGTYLIVDGERRFRAATELALKEVPALLQAPTNDIQRLIEQFHIQEQHEGWSATEKAVAVLRLSEAMEVSTEEIGKLLGIPQRTIQSYVAFANIIDKKNFERSKIGIRQAPQIESVKNLIKKVLIDSDMEYDRNTGKAIENAIYIRIGNGEMIRENFFTKIKDSVKQNPKIVTEFIENDELTVEKMFQKTNAKGAQALRAVGNNARYLNLAINQFLKEKSVKVEHETIKVLKQVLPKIKDFITEFETE